MGSVFCIIETKQEIYGLLREAKADGRGVILYSTEDAEMEICDRAYILRDGVITEELRGTDITVPNIVGLINSYFRVPAMITTLATGYILFSINLISAPFLKTLPNPVFVTFINKSIGGISMLTYMVILAALLLSLLLYKTPYGKQLHAVGQNRVAAAYAGIPVRPVVIAAFTLAGVLPDLRAPSAALLLAGLFRIWGLPIFCPQLPRLLLGVRRLPGEDPM